MVCRSRKRAVETPRDILDRYRSADILPGNRVVFNIKGIQYRLVVKIHYNTGNRLYPIRRYSY